MTDPLGTIMLRLAHDLFGCTYWDLSRQERTIVSNTAMMGFLRESGKGGDGR